MTSNALRKEVLQTFKNLHRTSSLIFKNNSAMVELVRKEINNEFRKNKNVSNVDSIKELIKFSSDVIYELKTTVVELQQTAPGRFKMKLRPEMFEEHNHVPLKKLTK